MKNLKYLLVTAGILLTFTFPSESKAQLDPRIKALANMAVYGAVGGLLLGTASLAFDTPGRSPFIGASLGLYAGILFGSYIVITHAVRKHRLENPGGGDDGYYPETPKSPYETPFGSGGYDDGGDGGGYQYWQPKIEQSLQLNIHSNEIGFKARQVPHKPVFYLNLLNVSF